MSSSELAPRSPGLSQAGSEALTGPSVQALCNEGCLPLGSLLLSTEATEDAGGHWTMFCRGGLLPPRGYPGIRKELPPQPTGWVRPPTWEESEPVREDLRPLA